jgi:hypothetical protein
MFQGVSQCVPAMNLLYFGLFHPFHCSPLVLYHPLLFFNTFQYKPLYSLCSQMLWFTILMLYHSSFLSLVPWNISTSTNMFYIWGYRWSCLFLSICLLFGSIFHIWEKTCSLCSSWAWLTSLNRCPTIAPIYFPTTCHYSLWLIRAPFYIYIFSWSIHQL